MAAWLTPWQRRPDYLRAMTLVIGQRNRLAWSIPAADSFVLNQAIYQIGDADYQRTLAELRRGFLRPPPRFFWRQADSTGTAYPPMGYSRNSSTLRN